MFNVPRPTSTPPQPTRRPGRPSGAKGKRTSEAARFAAKIVDDPDYLEQVRVRALAGTLAPGIEALLWYYRFGKPVSRVELTKPEDEDDLMTMSSKELAAKAQELAEVTLLLSSEEQERPLS